MPEPFVIQDGANGSDKERTEEKNTQRAQTKDMEQIVGNAFLCKVDHGNWLRNGSVSVVAFSKSTTETGPADQI